jgi:hypothetical protein
MPKKAPKGKGEAAAATLKSTRKAPDRSPPFSTAATRRGARGMPQTENAEHEAADETAANEVAGVSARTQEYKERIQEATPNTRIQEYSEEQISYSSSNLN